MTPVRYFGVGFKGAKFKLLPKLTPLTDPENGDECTLVSFTPKDVEVEIMQEAA